MPVAAIVGIGFKATRVGTLVALGATVGGIGVVDGGGGVRVGGRDVIVGGGVRSALTCNSLKPPQFGDSCPVKSNKTVCPTTFG